MPECLSHYPLYTEGIQNVFDVKAEVTSAPILRLSEAFFPQVSCI